MVLTRTRLPMLALLLLALSSISRAQDKAPAEEAKVKTAVEKGLKWLASKQNEDGSWSDTRYPNNTAITAYAMRAFMANGHWPDEGAYREVVAKGQRCLLASGVAHRAGGEGYLIGPRGGNMYCHALATQTLAELFARSKDKAIEPVLEKAVQLILQSQTPKGGWRYEPRPISDDISVTAMQLIALRSAKSAGVKVPEEAVQKALTYIKSCADKRTGGYLYQPYASSPGFARTAAALRSMQVTGEWKPKDHEKSIKYLQDNFDNRSYFFYGHVYAVHVMKDVGGDPWEQWQAKVRKTLLPGQADDGSWASTALDSTNPGPTYRTSLAVLILSVPAK